jgi:acyl-CoA synthetase (AMP-forming)/AMP-acid ligase II
LDIAVSVAVNTADYLLQTGDDSADALLTDHARYTYADLRAASARMVAALLDAGVAPGDCVGLLANNSLFWVATYLAALKLNAVIAPLPAVATPQDVGAMAAFVGCRVQCVEGRLRNRFAAALPPGVTVLTDEVLAQPGAEAWPVETPANGQAEPQDAALMFTSGTTARPRAVRVTHRNIQANTDSIIEYLGLSAAERMLVVLPFFYCFGTSLLHTHLRVGGTLVLSNSFTYPETVLDRMEAAGCTAFAGVPSTFQTLLRNSSFPRRSLPALRKIQQAGGKLPTPLIEELLAAAPQAELFIMYGQTEATARLSYLPPAQLRAKLGSVGRGIPGVTLRVMNEQGADVRSGEVGEVYAWGDSICPGYFNDSDASAQKFVAGALKTGDLATVDADGYIFITDRKSDFIKSYGHRVSSQQIETCVLELPSIVAAAAIGEPDIVRGEAIKVFITLREGATLTPDEVIAHCARRLAHHMVPRDVLIVDHLPVNAHGKVVKSELRALTE